MIRQITLIDQPVVRRRLKAVTKFDDSLKNLAQDLIDTMLFANGAGLAANQIGHDAQIFVTGIGPKPQIFINPKLKAISEKNDLLEEGCLSVPGYRGPVKRSKRVEITYDDLKGRRKKLLASGYLARVLQHEFDHLQGKLYLDRVSDPKLVEKVIPVRVVFFGSGEFAVPILISLVGLNWTFDFQTVAVVTQPSRPAGRERQVTPTPAYLAAQHFSLPVLTPQELGPDFRKELQNLKPDLIVLADYGKILPPWVLELPKYGALNIHPSLLPKYRGASPIQQTILNGETKSGATLIKMSPQVDAGEILGQYQMQLHGDETYTKLSEQLAQLGAILLRDLLPYYIAGDLKPAPQASDQATPAPKIPSTLGLIESADSAQDIDRKVRALNPNPGVYTLFQGKRVKILQTHLEGDQLVIDKLQPEGGKPMAWEDFKNGYPGFSLTGRSAKTV